MDRKIIQEKFVQGYDCSQVVFSHVAEKLGMSKEMANKVAACFGGGMMQGETCGAFTGALMAIGLAYGHYEEETLLVQKERMMEKYAEFRKLYYERYTTNKCKELLGYDVSIADQLQEALESGKMLEFCPIVVEEIIKMVEEVIL